MPRVPAAVQPTPSVTSSRTTLLNEPDRYGVLVQRLREQDELVRSLQSQQRTQAQMCARVREETQMCARIREETQMRTRPAQYERLARTSRQTRRPGANMADVLAHQAIAQAGQRDALETAEAELRRLEQDIHRQLQAIQVTEEALNALEAEADRWSHRSQSQSPNRRLHSLSNARSTSSRSASRASGETVRHATQSRGREISRIWRLSLARFMASGHSER